MTTPNKCDFLNICLAKKPDWLLCIGGRVYYETYGCPNRFHRFMQKLFFGFEWMREPKP